MAIDERVRNFCNRFGLKIPILLAPMSGASPPSLSIAVANAGGMGACGALTFSPQEIVGWAKKVRESSNGAFQINLWIPEPAPKRNSEQEAQLRSFLSNWGPEPAPNAGDTKLQNFDAQLKAILEVRPPAVSSVMGLFPESFVRDLKAHGIAWFATATTLTEARAAAAAGADVITVQGMEAGGHRGAFNSQLAERQMVGLFSLIPAVVDAFKVPVVAAGGIADGRGVAAALALGASAVEIGTGFLRCPESDISRAWADALAKTAPEDTLVSRVFSGRPGRSLPTEYVMGATAADAPQPAPYPVQRGLTAAMREAGTSSNDLNRIQAWAGQSASLASSQPAADVIRRTWNEAREILRLSES
jgi:nitronate monooxygenase